MKRALTIIDAIGSRQLFAPWFRKGTTWDAWFAFLSALFGLPMTEAQRATYQQCTGREGVRAEGYTEAWLTCGRRSGKSFILALIAVFLACFKDWSAYLSAGERGTIVVIATDRRQARTIFRYIRGLLTRVPALAPLIQRQSDEALDLTNGIIIEVMAASFRSLRGYTIVAALCDEIAFWRTDEGAANPDTEILNALRPAMATIPGAMLLCASSPYARRGELYRNYRQHFGQDAPVLIWKAPTRVMNPSVPQSLIDDAFERDPAWASAEYGAEFRSDIESYISRETLDHVIVAGRLELPPLSTILYSAFVDPSGGSGDSMTLAIAHREMTTGKAIIDALREVRPPFSPEAVVQEFAALLHSYRVASVQGDRYAGEWPRERFREHGIRYEPAAKVKSDLYRDLLPIINSRQAELPDHARLITQLTGLERRTARGGKDSIDHAPGAHDDLANVVAGAVLAVNASSVFGRGTWAIARSRSLPGVNGSAIRHQQLASRRHSLRFRDAAPARNIATSSGQRSPPMIDPLEKAELCAAYGVTGMTDAALAKLQAATTHDAAGALYDVSPNGGLRGRFRPELTDTDLPASVEQTESALISQGYGYDEPNGEDWQMQSAEESDIEARRRLNRRHAERYAAQGEGAWGGAEAPNLTEAERAYYARTAQGHAPGDPPVAGPNARRYGVTGEGTSPDDYINNRGIDPRIAPLSPPVPRSDPAGAYLRATNYFSGEPSPLSTGSAQRVGAERDLPSQKPNRSPYIAAAYPSGPSPMPVEQASGYATNFGIASPNVGDPDRWTNQRGASPSRYDPQTAARNRAEDEALGLRALNNLHRDRYDRGIRRRPLSWNFAMRGM